MIVDWGDAPGWAGALLGGGALVVSILAWRGGNRAADRANKAAERSARAAEETLADQRAAAAPKVRLVVENRGGFKRRIRNAGELPARNVEILAMPTSVVPVKQGPIGGLEPGEAWDFVLAGTHTEAAPSSLRVIWDGQAEPVTLPVP